MRTVKDYHDLTVGDLLIDTNFSICADIRILEYTGEGDETIARWDSRKDSADPPEWILRQDITVIDVNSDGYLEIEFVNCDLF